MKRPMCNLVLFVAALFVCLQTWAIAQINATAIRQTRPESSLRIRNLSDFFPLEVGNEWVYSDGADAYIVRVLSRATESNRISYFEIEGYFPDDQVRVRKIRQGPLGQILEYNPAGEDFLWYRFGLLPGAWIFETGEEIPCVTGSRVVIGSSSEKVDISAAIYEPALRLDFAPPCADAGIGSEHYVRGIGLVQRVWTTFAGPRTVQLVSARVGSREILAAPYGVLVSMDRPVYYNNLMPPVVNPWPTARVLLMIRNRTEMPVEFRFRTGQRFDFIVRDAFGNEVLRWSDGRMFPQVLGREILLNETRTFPARVLLKGRDGRPLPAGSYTLAGYLTTEDWESGHTGMLGVVPFEIRNIY